MGHVVCALVAVGALWAAASNEVQGPETYRSLMEKGANLCKNSPYYSEGKVFPILGMSENARQRALDLKESIKSLLRNHSLAIVKMENIPNDLDKIARYCLLITEEQDCLQYCINEKLGMQKNEHWDRNVTITLLYPLLMKEFYPPNSKEKDIQLDIKYCIEKSALPNDAELVPTDYCEVAEYVHFCLWEHFPDDKKVDCYPE